MGRMSLETYAKETSIYGSKTTVRREVSHPHHPIYDFLVFIIHIFHSNVYQRVIVMNKCGLVLHTSFTLQYEDESRYKDMKPIHLLRNTKNKSRDNFNFPRDNFN